MLECAPLPRRDILLMTPDFGVSTADAYRWLDEDRARQQQALASMSSTGTSDAVNGIRGDSIVLDSLALSSWSSIARFARNDFEAPVIARHPRLEGYLEAMRRSRAQLAMMTGSGSSIFGALDSPANFAKVPAEHRGQVLATKTSIDVVQPLRVG